MSFKSWAGVGVLTFAAIVAGVMLPHAAGAIAATWTLLVLAVGSFALTSTTRRAIDVLPPGFDRVVRRRTRPVARPEDLERLERSLGWKTYEPREFDNRVRPLLRELITARARDRFGVDAVGDPQGARVVMDPELVDLAGDVRAKDLYNRALTTDDIMDIVTRIERLT